MHGGIEQKQTKGTKSYESRPNCQDFRDVTLYVNSTPNGITGKLRSWLLSSLFASLPSVESSGALGCGLRVPPGVASDCGEGRIQVTRVQIDLWGTGRTSPTSTVERKHAQSSPQSGGHRCRKSCVDGLTSVVRGAFSWKCQPALLSHRRRSAIRRLAAAFRPAWRRTAKPTKPERRAGNQEGGQECLWSMKGLRTRSLALRSTYTRTSVPEASNR